MSSQPHYIPIFHADFSTPYTTTYIAVTDSSQCKTACSNDPFCKGYITDGAANYGCTTSQCWLKYNIGNNTEVISDKFNQKRHTYFKNVYNNTDFLFLKNTDFPGNDYPINTRMPSTDIQSCITYCSNDNNCVGFITWNNQCLFKTSLGVNGKVLVNANSYIKGF